MPHSKIASPFKFLDSYKKKDYQAYFGRDQESIALYDLYKDSSIMILHGPSGSGKTSLIYCGLLNKIREDRKVISIRRDNNLIESIKKKLFIYSGQENWTADTPLKLLDDFFSSHEDLNRILGFIEHIEALMLNVEEEIIEHKRNKKKVVQTPPEQFTLDDSNTEIIDDQYKISKYKERLQQFILERKELLEKLREKSKQVSTISDQLNDYFINTRVTNSSTSYTPLIIFDQFEELFVHGTKEEINRFGLFLKLIFDHKIPFNIIISLREEYFGYLDQLQSYIPHIFYKKIRLAHPDKESIKNIIEKSFQKFNINQHKGNTSEELSDIEKQSRIELILDQIKIKDNGSTSYHLPFLQVYLDRLYKIDYYRTYGGYSSTNENETLLPLEFKEYEIKEFGSIEYVLENYIREINNKIIRNTDNKLNNKVQHKDSVIKFLRHFRTKDDHKKRVPIQIEGDNYYVINNQKLLNKIQVDIWENNDSEYNATVSEIINELKEKGILNVSTDYAELSHDIIAKVISNIRTEDDFRSLIKKDFISSFDIYEDTKDVGDLLSDQQIQRMNQCMSYIMNDDDIERLQRKKQFLKDSIEENQKEERKRKKLEKKLKLYFYYPFIVTCLIVILVAQLKEGWKNRISIEIHDKIGKAFEEYNIDKTSALNNILESERDLRHKKIFKSNYHFKFLNELNTINLLGSYNFNLLDEYTRDLLYNFKNNLYRDYNRTPFYHNSISIPLNQGESIKATKTRRSKDVLYVYALTKSDSLVIQSVQYKKKNAHIESPDFKAKNNILAFEPFRPDKNNEEIMMLIAQKEKGNDSIKLKLLNQKGEPQTLDEDMNDEIYIGKASSNIDIEYQEGYSFLIGVNHKLKKLEIDLTKKRYKIDPIQFNIPPEEKIRKIKVFKDGKNFLILYGENKIYTTLHPNIINILSKEGLKEKDSIYTFKKIQSKTTILLGLKGRIKEFDLESLEAHDHYIQDEQINTIDLNDKGQIVVSSRDNGANLWSFEKFNTSDRSDNIILSKQFIGHDKPLKNVSFIKNDENYIITSSEDNTIKIWNIKPIEVFLSSLPGEIAKIEYHEENKIKITYTPGNDSIKALEGKSRTMFLSIQDTITKKITNKIRDIDFSKNEAYKVSRIYNNMLLLMNISKSNYEIVKVSPSITRGIKLVDLQDDLLLTTSSDNTVQIYEKEKDEDKFTQIPSIIRHDYSISSAIFSPDGIYIITGDIKGNIKKWDFRNFDKAIEERTYTSSLIQ